MQKLKVSTQKREQVLDITKQVQAAVSNDGCLDGWVVVYCPHTTAALSVNENADPDVKTDLLQHLSEMIPQKTSFRHCEGNSDAHIKTILSGPSLTLIVENGHLQLGTWQGLYFLEFDGPREREVWLKSSRA
jgi:secondary thiamine-phosphate synthase enzyme